MKLYTPYSNFSTFEINRE